MATSKMAFLCYLASKHHFVPVTFGQPLYSKATEIILDSQPCSLLETIVLEVGDFQTFVNLVLTDSTELNRRLASCVVPLLVAVWQR